MVKHTHIHILSPLELTLFSYRACPFLSPRKTISREALSSLKTLYSLRYFYNNKQSSHSYTTQYMMPPVTCLSEIQRLDDHALTILYNYFYWGFLWTGL